MSWLLSPSSATKMTAVLSRKASIGFSSGPAEEAQEVDAGSRPSLVMGRATVESLVRHREVARRTGPGGQCVDTAVGDYSLSPSSLEDASSHPRNASRFASDSPRETRHSYSFRIDEPKPSSRMVLNDSSA